MDISTRNIGVIYPFICVGVSVIVLIEKTNKIIWGNRVLNQGCGPIPFVVDVAVRKLINKHSLQFHPNIVFRINFVGGLNYTDVRGNDALCIVRNLRNIVVNGDVKIR